MTPRYQGKTSRPSIARWLPLSRKTSTLEMWLSAFESLFTSPFGWEPVGYTFAHNMWLDIARMAGLLAFIPFLIVTILHGINLLKLFHNRYITNFTAIIISLNVAMLLSSFVEPVIEGSLLFFCILMMIWGITKSLAMENKLKGVN